MASSSRIVANSARDFSGSIRLEERLDGSADTVAASYHHVSADGRGPVGEPPPIRASVPWDQAGNRLASVASGLSGSDRAEECVGEPLCVRAVRGLGVDHHAEAERAREQVEREVRAEVGRELAAFDRSVNLFDPQPAANGFGIPGPFGDTRHDPAWLAVKATRDIAIGIVIAVLLINGTPRLLGCLMLTVALIPMADGTIVLRSGGSRTIAYAVHWATAALMLTVGALLIVV
jgi:hypothetical protein